MWVNNLPNVATQCIPLASNVGIEPGPRVRIESALTIKRLSQKPSCIDSHVQNYNLVTTYMQTLAWSLRFNFTITETLALVLRLKFLRGVSIACYADARWMWMSYAGTAHALHQNISNVTFFVFPLFFTVLTCNFANYWVVICLFIVNGVWPLRNKGLLTGVLVYLLTYLLKTTSVSCHAVRWH